METDPNQSSRPSWLRILFVGRNPKLTLVRIVVLITLALFCRAYVLLPIRIHGPSMMPTYQENGINFINRLAYLRSEPQRGDVVAIRFSGEHILLMKRIIALPGETIAFHQGKVIINGEVLDEPYEVPSYPSNWEIAPKTLPPGYFYVVGDNRTMPEELHTKGEAPRDRIVGKVLLCKNLFASSSLRP